MYIVDLNSQRLKCGQLLDSGDGAAKVKKNVSPVVKNSSSTDLFTNLHTDYLMPLEPGKKYGEIFHTMSIIFCWSSYNYLGRDNKSHLAAGLGTLVGYQWYFFRK